MFWYSVYLAKIELNDELVGGAITTGAIMWETFSVSSSSLSSTGKALLISLVGSSLAFLIEKLTGATKKEVHQNKNSYTIYIFVVHDNEIQITTCLIINNNPALKSFFN